MWCNWKYGFALGGKLMIRFKKFLISAWISVDIRSMSGFYLIQSDYKCAESQVLLDFHTTSLSVELRTLLKCVCVFGICHMFNVSQFNNFNYSIFSIKFFSFLIVNSCDGRNTQLVRFFHLFSIQCKIKKK